MSGNYKKSCCNPYYKHKKIILKSLCPIPQCIVDKIDRELAVPSNAFVCTTCLKKNQEQCQLPSEGNEIDSSHIESTGIAEENQVFQDEAATVNTVFSELRVTPVKLRKYILKKIQILK